MLNEDTFGEEAMNETQLDALNDDTFGEEAMNETQLDALNDDTFGEAAQAEMREDALNDLTFHAVTLRSRSLSWLPLASRNWSFHLKKMALIRHTGARSCSADNYTLSSRLLAQAAVKEAVTPRW